MRVEKKYTHRVVFILLLIGVFARTAYGAIREAWRTIPACDAYDAYSVRDADFISFIENNQPSFWDIAPYVSHHFFYAIVLAIPIYICYLASRRFFLASFVFKVYLFWYVLLAYALISGENGIAYDNCRMGAAYIGFVIYDIMAAIAVPAVLIFLSTIERWFFSMPESEDSGMNEK